MNSLPTLAILASGRGSNCRAILEAITTGKLAARCAVVLSDNPQAPVLEMAREYDVEGLHLDPGRPGARLTSEAEDAYVAAMKDRGVEWIALAGFMRIVGKRILEAFPGRIVNIHPSLLPSFPGLDAQGQAWKAGVKVAGCTVHFVDAGVDTGPIIAQECLTVLDTDTEDTLRERILEIEHTTYVKALQWALGGSLRVEDRRVRCTASEGN